MAGGASRNERKMESRECQIEEEEESDRESGESGFSVSPEPLPAILVSNPSVGRHLVGRPRLGGRCYISSSGGLAELGGG